MDTSILEIFHSSFLLWIYIYGFLSIYFDILYTSIPVAIIGIVLFSILICVLRIPPPDKYVVEAVVGRDPNSDDSDGNDNYVMRTVAHRGAGLDAPENSLAAFRQCSEKGCNAVEFDVSYTADGVPIVFHDETLERMTGSMKEIRKMTWDELSKIDISVKHPYKEKFTNTGIARLEETIVHCLENKQKMFIDIKEYNTQIVSDILELYKKYPKLHTMAVCSSFFPNVIYMIRRGNPKIVCSLAWRPYIFSSESYSAASGKGRPRSRLWYKKLLFKVLDGLLAWMLPRFIFYVLGISLILLHKDVISAEVVRQWRNKGVRVVAWTVNYPSEKQHFSRILKITYITDTLTGESTTHSINHSD